MLAEMIIIQRLTHPWEVGLRHVPDPGCTISENLPHGDGLPARIADDLCDTGSQILRCAQDTNIAACQDGAQRGLLWRGFEPTHQDGAHLRFLPAPVDMGHDPIHGDLHAQLRAAVARPQRVPHGHGLLVLALGLPPLEVLGRAVNDALGPTRA